MRDQKRHSQAHRRHECKGQVTEAHARGADSREEDAEQHCQGFLQLFRIVKTARILPVFRQ